MQDPFIRRIIWLTVAGSILIMLNRYLPIIESIFAPGGVNDRVVSARGDLAADEKTTIELFEKSKSSVVYITTKREVVDFWTRDVLSVPSGTGSGFIWDEAGHVVTNFHVVKGASEAWVKLADGRDYRAALVGVSPQHDIAVLRIGIAIKRPPPVPIGTSHDLKVGQKVFAIGNPFGLDWTLTNGIVSALDRSLATENRSVIEHLIQTDAAINPGNSGGPLLDSAGRLIGINTAIYSPSGASAGIGFAVPVDTVMRVVPQLIRNGKYTNPTLGIEVNDAVNQRLAEIVRVQGVYILKAKEGGPANIAGLKSATITRDGRVDPGDVIVELAGKKIDSVAKLQAMLDDYKAGETVTLSVWRDGEIRQVKIILQPGNQ